MGLTERSALFRVRQSPAGKWLKPRRAASQVLILIRPVLAKPLWVSNALKSLSSFGHYAEYPEVRGERASHDFAISHAAKSRSQLLKSSVPRPALSPSPSKRFWTGSPQHWRRCNCLVWCAPKPWSWPSAAHGPQVLLRCLRAGMLGQREPGRQKHLAPHSCWLQLPWCPVRPSLTRHFRLPNVTTFQPQGANR